jgi:hypothetical protein
MKPLSVLQEKVAGVWPLLDELGYSLQSNRKTQEGKDHPDRDVPYRHINTQVKAALCKAAVEAEVAKAY